MAQTGRLLSLDVMRGITIAGMILVNNPGSWSHIYAPLRHARWDGLTPTDLVFPFFMFIMGVSMFFSLKKYEFKLTKESVIKILRRTVLIFLVGLVLNFFDFVLRSGFENLENLRILGVLQRLALAYGIGSLIGLAINHKYLLHTAIGILVFYAALLGLTNSTVLSENNIIGIVDRAIVGATHMARGTLSDGTRVPFDPEGLLSAIGSIGHVLLGFYAGKLIMEAKKDNERIIRNLFILGVILAFAGLLFDYGFPINKKLWSSTFVLTTCGFASLLLALLIWIVDINGKKNQVRFFESFGINPLYLYVQAGLLSTFFSFIGFTSFMYSVFTPVFGQYGGSLVWALLFVGFNWVSGYFLYKKQIYIKL